MKISVILEALTGSFDTDIDRSTKAAERRLKEMERDFNTSMQRIGTIVTVGATALAALSKHAIDDADAQRDLAQQVGLTVEKLSELSYAAIQDGASQEELGKAIFKLNEVMVEAVQKGGAAADTLKKFGISTQDLISGAVGTDEALKRIADKFNAMPDGAQKSALAAELLGTKLGQKMIPFLNEGSAGLKRLADQAHATGAVLDDLTADQLAKVNDQLDAFGRNLLTHVEVGLAAVLTKFGLLEQFVNDKAIERLDEQIAGLNYELKRLQDPINQGETEHGGILGKLLHAGDAARIAEITRLLKELEKERAKLANQQVDNLAGRNKKGDSGIIPPDQQDAIRKQIRDFNEQLLKAAEQYDKTLQDVIDKYDTQGAKARQLTADQIILQRAAADGNQQAIDALNRMAEGVDQLGEDAEQTADKMTEFWKEAAHNMQDAFAEFLFDPFKDGLDGMLRDFEATLQRMLANAVAAQIFDSLGITQFIGGLAGGAGAQGSAVGKRAAGGPVTAGEPYWVGENGPELVIPKSSGFVIPNNKAMAMGGVTQVFNITTPNSDSFRASERQILRRSRQRIGL